MKNYNKIICADGAANKVIQTKLKPDLIMGDLDSVKRNIISKYNTVELKNQQNNDLYISLERLIFI